MQIIIILSLPAICPPVCHLISCLKHFAEGDSYNLATFRRLFAKVAKSGSSGNRTWTLSSESVAIGSKYDVISYSVAVKPVVWSAFAMSLEAVLM